MADSDIFNHPVFSFVIIESNMIQHVKNTIISHFFVTFLQDLYIAKAEINRNTISKLDHQNGLSVFKFII